MKKNLKYLLMVLPILWATSSCNDDFLEAEPVVEQLEDNYYQTDEQVFLALVAAYDPIGWTIHGGYWISPIMFGEIRSDNANAGGDNTDTDQPGWQEFDDFRNTVDTNESRWIWHKNYFGIYRTNLVINNVDFTSGAVARYQAEAKFLRAYYHFDLFRHYGPIPVVTEVLASEEEYLQSRNTMTEVFDQITTDLMEAIPDLPQVLTTAEGGRVSRGAAQAMLGKVYLYWADMANDDQATFDLAAAQLQAVVDGGQYDLLDDYDELFQFEVANSVESVFEIQHTNQHPSDWGWTTGVEGNAIIQLCGVRGMCSDHPEYEEGWGFMMVTQDLVDAYLPDDMYRYDAAIMDGPEIASEAGGCSQPVDINQHNPQDYTGYFQEKHRNFKAYTAPVGGDDNLVKHGNEYVIRYADVLLMLAEALHRGSGSDAQAMAYIDQVRERAAGPGDNTGAFRTASDLMTDEGWSLLDVIWYERRIELALEGDRWYDLVRSGRAEASLFAGDPIRSGNFTADDIWIPIGQREIDATDQTLSAYPDASLFQ